MFFGYFFFCKLGGDESSGWLKKMEEKKGVGVGVGSGGGGGGGSG